MPDSSIPCTRCQRVIDDPDVIHPEPSGLLCTRCGAFLTPGIDPLLLNPLEYGF